jgi:CheY-like chemotaxis protein
MDDLNSLGGPAETEALSGYRILVVDDEEDVRIFLLALFADAGAQICEAEDGYEAVEKAVSERPDLITLDLSMPGHDGVEAFRDLRRNPETASIPVCIVTGHPEFRELLYSNSERPPEGYMNKPIDAKELVTTVRRILGLLQRRRERQPEH